MSFIGDPGTLLGPRKNAFFHCGHFPLIGRYWCAHKLLDPFLYTKILPEQDSKVNEFILFSPEKFPKVKLKFHYENVLPQ